MSRVRITDGTVGSLEHWFPRDIWEVLETFLFIITGGVELLASSG